MRNDLRQFGPAPNPRAAPTPLTTCSPSPARRAFGPWSLPAFTPCRQFCWRPARALAEMGGMVTCASRWLLRAPHRNLCPQILFECKLWPCTEACTPRHRYRPAKASLMPLVARYSPWRGLDFGVADGWIRREFIAKRRTLGDGCVPHRHPFFWAVVPPAQKDWQAVQDTNRRRGSPVL